jgi:hypothetical protein
MPRGKEAHQTAMTPKTPDHQEYQECQGIIYSKEEQQSAVAWNFGTVYKRILSTVFLNDVFTEIITITILYRV